MAVESQKPRTMYRGRCGSPKAIMDNCSLSGLKSQRAETWEAASAAEVTGVSQKRETQRMAVLCSVCKLFPNLLIEV